MNQLCSATNYTAEHLYSLRNLAQADGVAVPRDCLVDYLRRAMAYYENCGSYTYATIKEILILARMVDPRALCMVRLLDLVYYVPRLGVKVLLAIADLDCEFLIAYRKDIIGIFSSHRGGGNVRSLFRAMSVCAPATMADAISRRGTWCSLANYVSETCMWSMLFYIKRFVSVDSTAAEIMMADNLPRAVGCGLFVDACVLSNATWPDSRDVVPVRNANTLLYHMATSGNVGHNNVRVFAWVDSMIPLHVTSLLKHPRCPAQLAIDVARTRNWIRRRVWMLALARLRLVSVRGRRLRCSTETLCKVVAIDAINMMIMAYV